MSVILLLVGLGGWLTLLVMQSYRISQETLENIQVFTSLLISGLPAGIVATDQDGRINIWNRSSRLITKLTSTPLLKKAAI